MKYTKFEIFNFKGIKHLGLDLTKQNNSNVITLVGLNESGKTTILQAIDWFYHPLHYNDHELMPKDKRANFGDSISVKANVKLNGSDEKEVSKTALRYGYVLTENVGSFILERKFYFRDSVLTQKSENWEIKLIGKKRRGGTVEHDICEKDPEKWKFISNYIKEKMLPPVVYYENFLFDIPDKIYLDTDISVENNSYYREVLQDVLNSLNQKLNIEKHLLKRFISGKSKDIENIEAVLDMASAKITDIVITVWQEILKSDDNNLFISLGNAIEKDEFGHFIQVKVREDNRSYYIRERSLGFRWFFSFVLFTYFRTFRNVSKENALFLLDEPASNLHSSAQTKLLREFEKVAENQVIIYTTHSHHMINPKWLSGTFVVKNEGINYETVDMSFNANLTNIVADSYYQFASQNPNQDNYFKPILDALDVQPGPLEFIPEMVMFEGRNDYYTLKYIKELNYVETDTDKYLYPGNGRDNVIPFIALYLAWGRNFLVVLDDDKGGRATKKKALSMFGPVVENRIFTLQDVESYWGNFEMENLFAHNDNMRVIHQLDGAITGFDKTRFNKALEKCWQEKIKVDLTKRTIDRFKKLFTFIDNKLVENRVSG